MNLVKENLKVYIPSIVDFLDHQDFPWEKVNSKFNKKIEERLTTGNQNIITVEASIYDIIISCKKGFTKYEGLLIYFNRLFNELIINLKEDERSIIKSTIWNVLISFDSKYLNFIGELSVLNTLLKSGIVKLIRCEVSLTNNKSIDFDVVLPDNGMRVLIEIVNIHLDPQKTEDDSIKIEQFLTKRLKDKRTDKTLKTNFADKVHIIPVLWGSIRELKVYQKFFISNKLTIPLVYEPMAYLTYSDSNDNYETCFKPISKLFKK